MISASVISKAIIQSVKDSSGEADFSKKLFKYLEKNHLLHLLPNVVRHLENHVKKEDRLSTMEVTVSHEPSDRVLKQVEKYLEKWGMKKIEVKIDKEVIGGVVMKGRHNIVDASLRSNFKSLKENLIK